jgi:uncharacterized protein
MIERLLTLPEAGSETFFLWGPRQTGKSTLLRASYPDAYWVDLLKADEFRRYVTHPERLREELEQQPEVRFVVIDEIQKVPGLLDEIHWLHENRSIRFALCGSSARKVRRGQANLLGGRALRYEMFGLTAMELGPKWDLIKAVNHGLLPPIYLTKSPERRLRSYVSDYLKEEVAAEGLVRNLPVFSDFLNIAALSDAELVNYSTVARECGVSSQTIRGYFDILVDTRLGRWLPAYRRRPKRRLVASPKFYFADVGVVNYLAKRRSLEPGSPLFGKAFENWCYHELAASFEYTGRNVELFHWRQTNGTEVDFVTDSMDLAVEAKATSSVTSDHLKGLRVLGRDHPEVGRRVLVCLEKRPRRTDDGIEILPVSDFVKLLWSL